MKTLHSVMMRSIISSVRSAWKVLQRTAQQSLTGGPKNLYRDTIGNITNFIIVVFAE